jgi:hypothetical protein
MEKPDTGPAGIILFFAITATALRACYELAFRVILWHTYGFSKVASEHLKIIKAKPGLVVSNGDVLYGMGFTHYAIGVVLWLPLTFCALILTYKLALPNLYRALSSKQVTQGQGPFPGLTILAVPALAYLVTAFLPMMLALALGLMSAVVSVIWLRRHWETGEIVY